jgi:hypothetical protein
MKCSFRSTSNKILTVPVHATGEFWSDVRERIHADLFLTEKNNILKSVLGGKRIISLSKYLTGIFSIAAYRGTEDPDGSIRLFCSKTPEKLANSDVVLPSSCLLLSRVPCDDTERARYTAYYYSVVNSGVSYQTPEASCTNTPKLDFEKQKFFSLLYQIRDRKMEELVRSMNPTPEQFAQAMAPMRLISRYAQSAALQWASEGAGAKRSRPVTASPWSSQDGGAPDDVGFAKPAPLKRPPSGIPRSRLRLAESEEEKKNAMVATNGDFVVLK